MRSEEIATICAKRGELRKVKAIGNKVIRKECVKIAHISGGTIPQLLDIITTRTKNNSHDPDWVNVDPRFEFKVKIR